eukprot:5725238-Prymnesium_polylepis.1
MASPVAEVALAIVEQRVVEACANFFGLPVVVGRPRACQVEHDQRERNQRRHAARAGVDQRLH